MSKESIFKELNEILKEEFNINIENEGISTKDKIKDIGLDSFEIVELIYEVEDRMGIKIENQELSDIETIEQLIDLMDSKKENNG